MKDLYYQKALITTYWVEFINKKKFAKAALDKNVKAFVVHISFLSLRSKITIHLAWENQIALLLAKEITILVKYADFANIFLKKSIKILQKRTNINKHAIKLVDAKQPFYKFIYSLGLIELKILKTYIKINLVNVFFAP